MIVAQRQPGKLLTVCTPGAGVCTAVMHMWKATHAHSLGECVEIPWGRANIPQSGDPNGN